ncbi:MAG: Crp/Fnr family transcriptional regulator [Cetobacterium sp.]|uniref:Crp/Fnr family transcriptional regulator n=1 Tax=Cetobacterium sp. TaxID=2071632 RepID=UPI003F39B2AA
MTFIQFKKNLIQNILNLNPKKKTFPKGTTLTSEFFTNEKVFIIHKGLIRHYHLVSDQKEFLLGCYTSNNLIPIDNLLEFSIKEKPFESFSIEICEDSEIYILDDSFLKNLLNIQINIYLELTNYIALFYEKLFFQIRDIKVFSTEDALLSLLFRAYNSYGNTNNNYIEHKILNKNLAKCLDSTEETISRILKKLEKENIIYKKNSIFILNDPSLIEKKLGCNYCKKHICFF